MYLCQHVFLNITTISISVSSSLFVIVIITMINIATINDYKSL